MTAADPSTPKRSVPPRRPTRWLWFLAAVAIGLVGVGAALASWTATPILCSSCHEVAPYVTTWKASSHARAGCPSCHEPVRPWYRFPETFAFRAAMAQRDLTAHQAISATAPLPASAMRSRPVPRENCLECHDLVRSVTLPPGLVMDHAKHVKRNKSCTSCHSQTAHPTGNAEKAVAFMAQCFTCHGRQPGAKARGNCDLCHTKSFSMRPQSHSPTRVWLQTHGSAAKKERTSCVMCHDESFCTNCHGGLTMPHPVDWAASSNPAHAQIAKKDPTVCARCHGGGVNLCSMCHHKGYNSVQAPWARNHASTVDQTGAAWCMSTCHDSLFCAKCHAQQGSQPASP